jgi:hypothetical protein
MSAMISQKNVSSDFLWDLLEKARNITNWINFFVFSALMSVLFIAMLTRWTIKDLRKEK